MITPYSILSRLHQKIRMGTSALISALNALPWEGEEGDSSGDEDDVVANPKMGGSMTEHETSRPKLSRIHSSLHTIRPLQSSQVPPGTTHQNASSGPRLSFPLRDNTIAHRARSPGVKEMEFQLAPSLQDHQSDTPGSFPMPKGSNGNDSGSDESGDERLAAGVDVRKIMSDRIQVEEKMGEREERGEMVKAAQNAGRQSHAHIGTPSSKDNVGAALREEDDGDASDTMETNENEKRRLRREKLSQRLKQVFGLEDREEVVVELRCWLLRSVSEYLVLKGSLGVLKRSPVLKGYMYLTKDHICFFAHMPDKENLIVKTGPLQKKASRTKLNTKFWVVLRNDVLSWYESTSDPYFPKGNVSLQYASSCDAIDDTRFKLRTSEKNYTFTAETVAGRDDWIKAIQKVMFKTQHEGESVKLIIPLEAVLQVEKSPTLEFAETIEITVVDPEDQMSVDSYFFASFHDNDIAFNAIHHLLDERPPSDLPRVASNLGVQTPEAMESSMATIKKTQSETETSAETGHRLSLPALPKISSVLGPLISRGGGKASDDASSGLSIPFRSKSLHKKDSPEVTESDPLGPSDQDDDEGYPPKQAGPPPRGMESDAHNKPGWTPGWIRKPAAKIFASSPSPSNHDTSSTPEGLLPIHSKRDRSHRHSVTEIVEPVIMDSSEDEEAEKTQKTRSSEARLSFASDTSDSSTSNRYDLMEKSETGHQEDLDTERKFRQVFSLNEKEQLIDRLLSSSTKPRRVFWFPLYKNADFFCQMIIPIRDLYGLKAQKAFRFGHSGLIVVIKGHEELFLEFSSSKRRTACITLLEERMEQVRVRAESGDSNEEDEAARIERRIMEDLDESTPFDPSTHVPPVSPSPLFASTTSTFLDFKPEPMKVTCLTIGSRGDVQPYIALCKGLQAEGHSVRIATHGEYKDWVEGVSLSSNNGTMVDESGNRQHGIEFASVGGDPAELMKMCVDNGMFTVSFMKEGLQKFRGWLDDLLRTSWEACQGSDLLIESPSAMGGIHIAEALRIPYFRAFTMPWTRTRAYPHAFAVPEHKKGGGYNYMTYTMFDQVFWRAIAGQVNRWRKDVLSIESTNFDKLEQHKVPFLYNFSPTVAPPPLDWTEWIHVTGYWFLENADESAAKEKKWSPPEDLLEFIDNAKAKGKKVVYIGFGSIVVSDPEEMTRCVVDAVVDSGVCAILSKGWSDRGSKSKDKDEGQEQKDEEQEKAGEGADGIKFPPEIYSIDSIDHSWLFPRIDAACHHGGAGTSGASLRAGIPTIIKPFFGDQAFWAERVESLNVGSAIRKLTSEHLSEALKKATTDEKQIAKAKVIGEMIRKENGVSKAIEFIYRDLEYAKSIIKPPPSAGEDGPLEKVSSILHRPLTSHAGDSSPDKKATRSSSTSPPRQLSSPHDAEGTSDEWSVVSEERSQSRGRARSGSNMSQDSSSGEDKRSKSRNRLGSIGGLGNLMGNLLPVKSGRGVNEEEATKS
ncbi:hypothetical protein P7C73_g5496, partial [Tremellales sp. Uapishka_1]